MLRHDDLPTAELDGPTREVKLLVDYRRDLVVQRTRVQNQLRWHLHELDPVLQVVSRTLGRYRVMTEIAERLEAWCAIWRRRCWRCLAAACSAPR